MIRRLFLPYFSKDKGPPRIRCQVNGVKRKRFFKIVVANQKDKKNGKHIEVLGTYVNKNNIREKLNRYNITNPSNDSYYNNVENIKEIRLRFNRVKFWLAANCNFSDHMKYVLSLCKIIPQYPIKYSRRCSDKYYHKYNEIINKHKLIQADKINNFLKTDLNIQYKNDFETSKNEPNNKDEYIYTPEELTYLKKLSKNRILEFEDKDKIRKIIR
ncbi:mitochondrial ribosomal protein S16 precursor, putative [Plasmodium reichenowi]|uniref:Mitochondrial ribosomal protein S16, putative n=1 Tax=Plasmodium reichenowi TaxID=5854 RepID=A0A060RUP8_PLARE|nr:mitochondrial ribosomal protein S16 precursor, putative [Plasmodium reichenowi]KYO01704.1 mitochondrial ribosomal protein S16 precursor, putative [Plasmodium reichenowi]CDO63187.1 mitochondrial ribosomal protein S16 precursor, putative [Plasmodium reichenowi]SOV76954.1 mitochondrial ribosomal protein S16 precursor, putative [Plasmodium reichenowi]